MLLNLVRRDIKQEEWTGYQNIMALSKFTHLDLEVCSQCNIL